MTREKRLRIEYVPQLRLSARGNWQADPLGGIAELRGLQRALDKAIRDTVGKARAAGHSWSDIGTALETTRQSAWERFGQSG